VDKDKGKTVIGPGASQKVLVSLSTKYVRSRDPYSKTVEVETNDPAEPVVRLTLRLTVKDVLLVRPDTIEFGTVRPGSKNVQEVSITNKGREPVMLTKISAFPGTVLSTSTAGGIGIDPGKTRTMQVVYRPQAPEKSFFGIIQIETNLEKLNIKTIQVKASVAGD
jgi:hypothetical protein